MHKRGHSVALRLTRHTSWFQYSSRLITLLLIALVGVVLLMLFTAAPVIAR